MGTGTIRRALYAPLSTCDRDHTRRRRRLWDFGAAHSDWHITKEYVDVASTNDVLHRIAWRQLNDDAFQHRFDAVLVCKRDRTFRSVQHMHGTLAVWDPLPIGFLSAQEGFDTTTALGRLLLNLLASFAEVGLKMIRERVTAGRRDLREEFRLALNILATGGGALVEIRQVSVPKDSAVTRVVDDMGISPAETRVFGDDVDDVELFRLCDVPVALGNAIWGSAWRWPYNGIHMMRMV